VQKDFVEWVGKPSPPKQTLLKLEKGSFETGSVKDKNCSGRLVTRNNTCAAMLPSVDRSSRRSTRKSQ